VSELIWIDEREALALHNRLLALYGGAMGLRDLGLLQSALARPRQLQAYGRNPEVIELAAAYTAGILHNHPFLDGNKRIGFVLGVLFLEMNGYRLTASEEDATQAVLGLTEGTLDEAAFVAWLRGNSHRERRKKPSTK
jgi:death-on-curing protein